MPKGVSHVALSTGKKKYKEMCNFYRKILAPLGYYVFMEEEGVYFAMEPKGGFPDFWLYPGSTEIEKFDGNVAERGSKTHVAFYANSRKEVDDWYRVAIKTGGVCNGPPGERPWMKGYFAAYIIDPVGNNIEVVYYGWLLLRTIQWGKRWGPTLVAAAAAFVAGTYFSRK